MAYPRGVGLAAGTSSVVLRLSELGIARSDMVIPFTLLRELLANDKRVKWLRFKCPGRKFHRANCPGPIAFVDLF